MTPETSYPAVLGALLVNKRKKLGLDQATVAKKVGVSRPTWSRIENGEGALGIGQLSKAAEVLEYKGGISELIGNTDKVVSTMKQAGIIVHHECISTTKKATSNKGKSPKNKMIGGFSLLGGAALALWIARVLLAKR